MQIESIKLRDFRNYEELILAPHPGVNILFGQNGSGKTNLLEAIHYCALGRSHRTSQDREVVRRDRPMAAIGVQLKKNGVRTDVTVKLTPGEIRRKTVFIDQKRASKLSDLMGRMQCVIFSPEDLMLVKEGPSIRRRFLDMMLSQLSTSYFIALQQYQKALEQRNVMLRDARRGDKMDMAMMDAFEEAMAVPCETIIPMRRKFVKMTGELAALKYASISGRNQEIFSMIYQCCLASDEEIARQVKEHFVQSRRDDIMRGSTSFGIHREDIGLMLSGREMKVFASQGQIRTAALSMKLAQLEIFRNISGETPILLLDDVMSELDMSRRKHLLQEITGVQTFITCTDETDLEGCQEKRSYHVSTDDGMAMVKENSSGEDVVHDDCVQDDLDFEDVSHET